MRLLVTRPAEDAAETAARLEAIGHEVMIAPMLDIRIDRNASPALDGVQALLFTSRNGVRAFAEISGERSLPTLAVGGGTAEAARDAGFAAVWDADGDVADLAALAARRLDPAEGRLYHAAGSQVAGDLKGALERAGFEVVRQPVYRAVAARSLPAEVAAALASRRIDAAIFFSPRSAEAFARVVAADRKLMRGCGKMAAVCISGKAAEALRDAGFETVRVAARPNQDAVIECLAGLAHDN